MLQRIPFIIFSLCCLFLSPQGSQAQSEFFAKIRALKQEGKLDQALVQVTQALGDQQKKLKDDPAGNPNYESVREEVGMLIMEKGLLEEDLNKLDAAQASFMSLFSIPNNLTEYANFELAKIALKSNAPKEALSFYKSILKMSPNMKMRRDAQFQMAKILNDQKQYKEARLSLVKIEKKNRHEEIYSGLIYELAKAERGSGNNPGFCKWAKKLYAHFPEEPRLSQWGFHLEENSFEGQPTHCSSKLEDRRQRIRNLQWAGLEKKALEEITQLKKGDSKDQAEAAQLEISYLLHQGEVEKAMALLKPLYESRKSDPVFLNLIANAAAKLGDPEAAIGSFYSAYKHSPRGKLAKEALYQSAFMSYQYQDYDGASRKFQEFLKAFTNSALARDAKWHLAWIRYLRADYEGALKSLAALRDDAKKKRRSSVMASVDRINYWMAMSLYRLGRYSESRVLLESLSQDKLMGFYSLAAISRLKKLDDIMPKAPQRVIPDENRRITRFAPLEVLLPADDPSWFREIANQKSDIDDFNQNDDPSLKQIGEDAEVAQELIPKEEGPDRTDETQEEVASTGSADDEDRIINFTNPMLIKRFERARDLMILGLQEWSRWDLYDIEKRTKNREYLKSLMQEYEMVESYNRSSYIGQTVFASQRAVFGIEGVRQIWEHTYPRAYSGIVNRYSREFSVPTELIWGIMRAESSYKRDVISPVGALGLMQVMPFTAQKVASLLGEKEFEVKKLLQPEGAVKIGSKYLQRLLKKFDGNLALVAAGYNAGPHRVRAWITSFGQLDLDEFIEHIPYQETRNYTKKVLTHFMIYNRLYNGKKESMVSLSDPLNSTTVDSILSKDNFHETMKESWDDI